MSPVAPDRTRDAAAAWFFDRVEQLGSSRRGQTAVVERSAELGSMPPLHERDVEESYRVVEGEVTFFVDGDVVHARAGDVVVAPAGAARTLRVESASARWLVATTVRALDRFVDFGRAVSAPVDDRATWPSFDELAAVTAIAGANGIELLGPPGAQPG